MKKILVKTKAVRLLSDTITPVSIYLKIRDVYPNSLLLESSDYHGNENSYSFICLKPLASVEANSGTLTERYPDGTVIKTQLSVPQDFRTRFSEYLGSFEQSDISEGIPVNGLFGYTSYDAVKYFEKIELTAAADEDRKIPDLYYSFYNYIVAINHFQNVLYVIENSIDESKSEVDC